jgi:hypothetical protein
MRKQELYIEIEKLLDEWDPIGILQEIKPNNYAEGVIGEYSNYVEPIIEIYLSNQPIYEYLVSLQTKLWDAPNEIMKKETKIISEKIIQFLSQYKIEDIL